MNKLTKNALRIAAIMIPIGFLLILVGIFTGAKRGVTIESGKVCLNEQKSYSYENYELTGKSKIDIDVNNAKIIIEESENDRFGINVNLSSIGKDPTVQVDQDEIRVEDRSDFGFHLFTWDFGSIFDQDNNNNIVTIYVPKNASLEDVTLHTSNGRVEITGLSTKSLKADSSNGGITTEAVSVDGSTTLTTSNGEIDINGTFSGETNAKSSNGKIIGSGMYLGKTTFKTSNGSISGDGTFKGSTTFHTSNSSISIKNNISRSDCNIDAETSNGTVKINGSKVGDDFSENNGSGNSLNLDSSNGSINIEFNK